MLRRQEEASPIWNSEGQNYREMQLLLRQLHSKGSCCHKTHRCQESQKSDSHHVTYELISWDKDQYTLCMYSAFVIQ